jgi:hypothetical protein
MGFAVSMDGVRQTGRDTNPFPALRDSMDPLTWRRVCKALLEVLDPEAGGDERLAALLRRTNKVEDEQQRRPAS